MGNRHRVVALALAAIGALNPGCASGRVEDVALTILRSPASNPLLGVVSLRVALGDPRMPTVFDFDTTTALSSDGRFDLSARAPIRDGRAITLEGLSTTGAILSLGRTRVLRDVASANTAASIFLGATNELAISAAQPQSRIAATMTLLADGRVLIAGGAKRAGSGPREIDVASIASVIDIYDPERDEIVTLPARARALHAAVALGDGGVALIGGIDATGSLVRDVEIFTPSAQGGALSLAQPLDEATARYGHAAVLIHSGASLATTVDSLADEGRILLIGGARNATELAPHVLYALDVNEPVVGISNATLSHRTDADATRLERSDGDILISGGSSALGGVAFARYHAKDRTFSIPAGGESAPLRFGHRATLLADERVLIYGGRLSETGGAIAEAWIYDADANASTMLSESLAPARADAVAVRTGSNVLYFGGTDSSGTAQRAPVLFRDGAFTVGAPAFAYRQPRLGATGIALDDGSVLVFGGSQAAQGGSTGELSRGVYCTSVERCPSFSP